MSNHSVEDRVEGSSTARNVRRLVLPTLLLWVAVAALTNILSPQLEVVGAARSVSLNAPDSPSIQAMRHIGQVFGEFDSDSAAMIVLEGDQPLGADAHHFYDTMVQRLAQDTKHVEHVQDFCGIRSRRAVHRARMARPHTCRFTCAATRAKRLWSSR